MRMTFSEILTGLTPNTSVVLCPGIVLQGGTTTRNLFAQGGTSNTTAGPFIGKVTAL